MGTFTGGSIREICYEIDGQRRHCYVLNSVMVDDWAEECWSTERRMTVAAAVDTILAARGSWRMRKAQPSEQGS